MKVAPPLVPLLQYSDRLLNLVLLQLSSLFRVPLNIFVVVSLLTGVSSARYAVLTACSIMLGFSSLMTGMFIVGRVDPEASEFTNRLE